MAEDKDIRPTLINPQYRKILMATGIVIVLLTATSWIGSYRTSQARIDTFRDATSALAVSLKQDLIDAKSMRTDTGRERLDPLVTAVAKAAGYRVVTLTDENGTVLASTDNNLDGEKLEDLPEKTVEIEKTSSGLKGTAPIKVGENAIGYIQIVLDF